MQREVFAADFRDRVVHHLIARKIEPLLEAQFIDDSYSTRREKGTLYGIRRSPVNHWRGLPHGKSLFHTAGDDEFSFRDSKQTESQSKQ